MEFVYVVPRARLFPEFYPHGFVPFGGDLERGELERTVVRDGYFVEREHAEQNPALKQVIPYSIVVVGDEVLLLRRLAKGGESRLHDKLSIGVGGHVNPEDSDAPQAARDPLGAGTRREIDEELVVRGDYEVERVGIINDDSNSVGAVHVGVVQVVTVTGTVAIRETDRLEGRMVSMEDLRVLRDQGADFETWSALLLDRLEEFLPQPVTQTSEREPIRTS
jgi:predicted NUDIX family phosphoesterase